MNSARMAGWFGWLLISACDTEPVHVAEVESAISAFGAPMSTERSSHTATVLIDGRVLVAGGSNSSGRLRSAELFSPSTGSWSSAGNMKRPRERHVAVRLQSGRVLIAGGKIADSSTDPHCARDNELYDPATGAWSSGGVMAVNRCDTTATLLPSGRVLVAGGLINSYTGLSSAELFDPATNTWSPAAAMPRPRAGHRAIALLNGKVLITGGHVNPMSGLFGLGTELYDETTNTWSSVARPAGETPSDNTPVLLRDGRVLMVMFDRTELWDPNTGTWTGTGHTTIVRAPLNLVRLLDGSVLTAGPLAPWPDDVARYDVESGRWSVFHPYASGRSHFTTSMYSNLQLLVAGGGTSSTEIYDLRTPCPRGAINCTRHCGSIGGTDYGSCGYAETCTGNICVAQTICAHPENIRGVALASACSPCASSVCARDGYCCSTSWDEICAGEAALWCSLP